MQGERDDDGSAMDDEALMARVGHGDRTAFRELAKRHAGRALALARRLCGSEAEAEDIVQDALLRVWVNAPRWRPLSSFRTWFYRVVVNLCLNRRRRPAFAPLEAAGDPVDPRPGPAEQAEQDERDRVVWAAIAELPDRQRAALVLTYREGLGNVEAAAILEVSVSALEALLMRAKRALRQRLATSPARNRGEDA